MEAVESKEMEALQGSLGTEALAVGLWPAEAGTRELSSVSGSSEPLSTSCTAKGFLQSSGAVERVFVFVRVSRARPTRREMSYFDGDVIYVGW